MNRANLIFHVGAQAVDREHVYGVPTPARTRTWFPIAHGTVLDEVQRVLSNNGLQVVSEAHGLTHDGARYFGLLQVDDGQDGDGWGLVAGVRNSHDKSSSVALALGASVWTCDNLSFSGQVNLARKHTKHTLRDLPQSVNLALGMVTLLRQGQEQRFLTYQRTELTDAQAHDLTICAVQAQILPASKVSDLLQEWRTPRHLEFRAGGKTAWRLFNAFTEVLKGRLDDLPRRTQALHRLLDRACGLLRPAVRPQVPEVVDADLAVARQVMAATAQPQLAQVA
jgi:hypothetical protein